MRVAGATRGFLLVETLVAGFVLTVASLALASALAQGNRTAETPREEYAARTAIGGIFADLSGTPFDQAATVFNGMDFEVPGLRPVRGDGDGLPGEVTFTYGPNGEQNVYTVTARVRWQGTAGERSIEVVRYLANVRGDVGVPPPLNGANATTSTGTVDTLVQEGTYDTDDEGTYDTDD